MRLKDNCELARERLRAPKSCTDPETIELQLGHVARRVTCLFFQDLVKMGGATNCFSGFHATDASVYRSVGTREQSQELLDPLQGRAALSG
jgi:hypothetical protein